MISMTSNAILEFILNLLRNHDAAVAYCTNPGQALAAAGLPTVTAEDIAAVAPMVAESALITGGSQLSAIVAARSLAAAEAGAAADAGLNLGTGLQSDIDLGLNAGTGLDLDLTSGLNTAIGVGLQAGTGLETGIGTAAGRGGGLSTGVGGTVHSWLEMSAGVVGSAALGATGAVGAGAHGTADVGGSVGSHASGVASSTIGTAANTWSSLDVSNAFGSGLDSSVGAHGDTGVALSLPDSSIRARTGSSTRC
jgi:hypothetical protein